MAAEPAAFSVVPSRFHGRVFPTENIISFLSFSPSSTGVPETTPWLLYELSASSYGRPRNRKLPGAPPVALLSVTCTASFARISQQTESQFPLDLRYFRPLTPLFILSGTLLLFLSRATLAPSHFIPSPPYREGFLGWVKRFARGRFLSYIFHAHCTNSHFPEQSPFPFETIVALILSSIYDMEARGKGQNWASHKLPRDDYHPETLESKISSRLTSSSKKCLRVSRKTNFYVRKREITRAKFILTKTTPEIFDLELEADFM